MAISSLIGKGFIEELRAYAVQLGNVVVDVAVAGVAQIKTRTSQGINADGTPFAPYSVKYANKYKKGMTSPVRLRREGTMMESVYASVDGTKIDTALGGGKIRGPYRGQTQALDDVRATIGVSDPKAQWYSRVDQKNRAPFELNELWLSEEADASLRRVVEPRFTDDTLEVDVIG
jgi:hypothetical protein